MWTSIKRLVGAEAPPQGNPLPPPLDLGGARRVLVIAPHPDDETMGCGGTLALLAPHCEIEVVLVTNGDGAGELPEGTSEIRKGEMAEALAVLGVTRPVTYFDEPDGRFEDSPRYRQRLARVLRDFKPNWVFSPWMLDSHTDHARIAHASCKVLKESDVESVLFYETWTPIPATHVVDITSTGEKKRRAFECHRTALACANYIEATFGLGAYRAVYLGNRNAKWAEAFAVRSARECDRT